MAKNFMDEHFLLENETSRTLYFAVKDEPIFDYHCHLIPSQIAENKQFENLSEVWLGADHYKWRMMRAFGFDESLITGDAPAYEKFLAWTKTVENLIGNPLYHFTHLELQRYFGIFEPLNERSAASIWERANKILQKPELSVKGIFDKFNVYAVGTTDDPVDSLDYHKAIMDGSAPIGKISTKVMPSFRPDKAININAGDFADYIKKLSVAGGIAINSPDDVLTALEKRLDYFVSLGCRASDHGLEYAPCVQAPDDKIEKTFKDALCGKEISREDGDAYKTKLLCGLSKLYAERNLVMQIHLSVIRNINARTFGRLGPDTGFDAVNDRDLSGNLASLLSCMEGKDGKSNLPKTILYSLNPKDYYPISTIMGGFQEGSLKSLDSVETGENSCKEKTGNETGGKMQFGTAWWFCDNRDGMEEQMKVLANTGMLPLFNGMLTDSRSFLSYPRHEYFRRILCNLIGKWVENGEYPLDYEKLVKIVRSISFENAKKYFGD